MKSLPREIINLIVLYLREEPTPVDKQYANPDPKSYRYVDLPPVWHPYNLAQYSVVSRQWQGIVEPIIWKRVCLQGSPGALKLVTYTTGDDFRCARVGYIRHILWRPFFTLPNVTDPIYHTKSNDPLFEWYDNQYRSELRTLFLVLESLGDQHPGLELILCDLSPYSRYVVRNTESPSLRDLMLRWSGALPACLRAKHIEDFPSPTCVRSLRVLRTGGSFVMLSSHGLILERLPNVSHASLHDPVRTSMFAGDFRPMLRQGRLLLPCIVFKSRNRLTSVLSFPSRYGRPHPLCTTACREP